LAYRLVCENMRTLFGNTIWAAVPLHPTTTTPPTLSVCCSPGRAVAGSRHLCTTRGLCLLVGGAVATTKLHSLSPSIFLILSRLAYIESAVFQRLRRLSCIATVLADGSLRRTDACAMPACPSISAINAGTAAVSLPTQYLNPHAARLTFGQTVPRGLTHTYNT